MVIKKIKLILWKLGLYPEDKCPYCGSELYGHYGGSGYWTCSRKKCKFN